MQLSEIELLKSKITPKIELGDYITLGKILKVAQGTARMRYIRNDLKAVLAMKSIITSREDLIKSFK
jgi:hypothetical protein